MGLLPFSASGTFEPLSPISPANRKQGSAGIMLYLPCRNWKGTGLLGEEADFITPLIRTSPWERAMWERVLSPFPSRTM